ncbi:MAG: tetratricopeptide repeat protein [Chitinophagales bacterium]
MNNIFYIRQMSFLAMFIMLIGLAYACNDGKANSQKQEVKSAPTTAFEPDSDTFNVLLLPFHPDKDCKAANTEMESQLMEFIETSQWAQAMKVNVQMLEGQPCPYQPQIAKKLGKEQNADVVIWGFYNAKKQKPEILYTWINDVISGHTGLPQLADLRNGFYLKDDVGYIGNWMIGVAACKANRWAEALLHFQHISTDKCDVAVTPMIGHCFYALQKEPQVDSIMQVVVDCVPEYVALAMRGWRFYISRKYQEALDDYTAALKINNRYKAAYEHRGSLLFENKKFKEAAQDFSQAIALGSDEESVFATRGIAYHNSGDRERAIEDYTRVLELNPKNSKANFDRANAHYTLGEYDKAIIDYTAGISKEPTTKRAYLNRGITYVEIDNYEAAIADFTHVLKEEPENVTALTYRGAAYSFHGKLEDAGPDFVKALILDPTNKMALSGREYLEKVKQMKDNTEAKEKLIREAKTETIIAPEPTKDGSIKFDLSKEVQGGSK